MAPSSLRRRLPRACALLALVAASLAAAAPASAAETLIDTVDFGSHEEGGAGKTETFAIGNDDVEPMTVPQLRVRADPFTRDFFVIEADGCSRRTLSPGDECAFDVRFKPLRAPLPHERDPISRADLLIGESFSDEIARIALTGRVLRPARLSFGPVRLVKPIELDTTAVGRDSAPVPLSLTNGGEVPGAVGRVTLSGSGAANFAVLQDGCSATTLAPGASCTFQVVSRPTTDGIHSAVASVTGGVPVWGGVPLRGYAEPPLSDIVKSVAGDWTLNLTEGRVRRAIRRKVLYLGSYTIPVTAKLRGTLYLRSKGRADRRLATATRQIEASKTRALRLIPVKGAKRVLDRDGKRRRLVLRVELIETSGTRTAADRVIRLR